MYNVRFTPSFEAWRDKAKQLLVSQVNPQDITWITQDGGFHFGEDWEDRIVNDTPKIPREYFEKAYVVSAFRDDSTWDLLYRIAWRILHEQKQLLKIPLDSDIQELESRYRLVMRDVHKMKAFVRFKEIKQENKVVYMAWHRPDHRIVRLAAPFFKDRFNGMNWVIMTEDETMSWDQTELTFSEGIPAHKALMEDSSEDLWLTYYRSIFNPARIKIGAMKKELPVRHWKTLPETELITSLINEAPNRLKEFYDSQRPTITQNRQLDFSEISAGLNSCKACGICEKATAPVMGEGPLNARIMFIGEQPGNEEDLNGQPFIGPAGQLLNKALNRRGFKRDEIYVTNAVKGFKWIFQNNMRWHRTANASEISACKPWLKQELGLIKPEIVVCLGRSAAQSILGKMIKMEDVRGKFFASAVCEKTIILPHPSSILRIQDENERALAFERFVNELQLIA